MESEHPKGESKAVKGIENRKGNRKP